jgi:DNA gyrase subunit A
LALIKTDVREIKEKYGDPRRTKVVPTPLGKFTAEDLIPDEQVIVTLTASGYVKRLPVDTYRSQIRGGKGVTGMKTKDEDAVEHLLCVSTHDDIFLFTNQGRIFRNKVYEIPASGRQAKGVAMVNIIQLAPNEKVTAVLATNKDSLDDDRYFFMATKNGVVKKTQINAYNNVRKTGIIAIKLNKGDELRWVKITCGKDIVVQVSSKGQAICYQESDVRPMGRSAAGVRGINLRDKDSVMAVDVIKKEKSPFIEGAPKSGFPDMLVVLENGFGKRTMIKHFHLQKRGGIGIKAANCTSKTGNIIGMNIIHDDLGDVVLASRNGQVIRMKLGSIKRLGRDTQGVTLMRLGSDKVSSVTIIRPEEENDANHTDSGNEGNSQPTEHQSEEVLKSVTEDISLKVKIHQYKTDSKTQKGVEKKEITKPKNEKSDEETIDIDQLKINQYQTKQPEIVEEQKPKTEADSQDEVNYWGKQ